MWRKSQGLEPNQWPVRNMGTSRQGFFLLFLKDLRKTTPLSKFREWGGECTKELLYWKIWIGPVSDCEQSQQEYILGFISLHKPSRISYEWIRTSLPWLHCHVVSGRCIQETKPTTYCWLFWEEKGRVVLWHKITKQYYRVINLCKSQRAMAFINYLICN